MAPQPALAGDDRRVAVALRRARRIGPRRQARRVGTEELGELAREINHYYGEKPKKASEKPKTIEEELGDVLFVLICFANSLNIDLSKAFDLVMNKFNKLDANRWTKIEGGTDRE